MKGENPYNDYITESCLDAIRTIEGPGYGLVQKDLARIRSLKTQHFLDIPTSITNVDVKTMPENLKREASGYLAICNTFDLDAAYGTDGDYFFKAMNPLDRSALLTLVHYTGIKPWLEEYNNPASREYSLLQAAKTGIREDMVKSLITKWDGSLLDWPDKENTLTQRKLAAIKLMYDIDNESFDNNAAKEKTFARWASKEDLMEDISGCIKGISEADIANAQMFEEDTDIDYAVSGVSPEEVAAEEAETAPENEAEIGVLTKLTNPIKKMFTKNEEE